MILPFLCAWKISQKDCTTPFISALDISLFLAILQLFHKSFFLAKMKKIRVSQLDLLKIASALIVQQKLSFLIVISKRIPVDVQ